MYGLVSVTNNVQSCTSSRPEVMASVPVCYCRLSRDDELLAAVELHMNRHTFRLNLVKQPDERTGMSPPLLGMFLEH
jgi:hypothetical protein